MGEGAPRRLAALLCADVAGYSRLMAEDEEATVRRLAAYRAQIEALIGEHRGHLVDFTGDNFLAEFPAALDAVTAAIEIQRVLAARNADLEPERRMEFRMGVHLGDVRVEGERVAGDGVNVAARLEALASPGGICVSAAVHEQVRARLPLPFRDLGERKLKNLPAPVRIYAAELQSEPSRVPPTPGRRRLRRALVAVAALLVLAAGLAALSWPRPLGLLLVLTGAGGLPIDPPLPDKPSVAVLPFENMSGEPEQDYFSDGITEDLTTDLARDSDLFVISRHSAFSYRGGSVKPEDVGRELGVRYVLEGSVRRSEDRIRITAQLIDATNGFHVWSERYDRAAGDIFSLQAEIADEIANELAGEISGAESRRTIRRGTNDLHAYDAYLRAMSHYERYTRADTDEARRWLLLAIERDPGFATAHGLLGHTYALEVGLAWSSDASLLERAELHARRALELDRSNPSGHAALAQVARVRGQLDLALDHAAKAIDANPSMASYHTLRSMVLAQRGNFLPALQELQLGARLDPKGNPVTLLVLGYANLRAGRRDAAVEVLERARSASPDLIPPRLILAAHYQSTGRHADARKLVDEILHARPDATAANLAAVLPGFAPDEAAEVRGLLAAAGLP